MKLVPPPVIPGGNGKEREIGVDESRQPRVRQPYSLWTSLRRWVIVAIDQEPPPSQGLRAREAWLRSYVTQEPFLVGVLNSAFDIDKNRGWKLEGAKDKVACYTQMLHTVDDGQGWREFITWMSQSYYLSRVSFVTEFGR